MHGSIDLERRATRRIAGLIAAHPGWSVFVLALTVRLAALLVAQVLLPVTWLALDDDTYSKLAADMATGSTSAWSPYLHELYETTATFLIPLTALFWVFGPSYAIGSVLVAFVGAAAAGMTTVVARPALEARWAVAAGAVVALLPSQIGWSLTTLKDPWVWFVAAGTAYAVTKVTRAETDRPVWAWTGLATWLFLLSHLRLHSTVVACWAMVLTVLLVVRPLRWVPIAGALLIALAIPWAAGAGPGGLDLVLGRVTMLDEVRAANAVGAGSAFVDETSASDSPDGEDMGPADLAHLPRGLSVMLLEPYPWDENRNSRVVFAKIDTILWYPVLGLAVVGVMWIRRYRRIAVFPLLYGGGVIVMYALAEGNLGTAFRHRGEAVWAAAILAAIGARELWMHRQRRSAAS